MDEATIILEDLQAIGIDVVPNRNGFIMNEYLGARRRVFDHAGLNEFYRQMYNPLRYMLGQAKKIGFPEQLVKESFIFDVKLIDASEYLLNCAASNDENLRFEWGEICTERGHVGVRLMEYKCADVDHMIESVHDFDYVSYLIKRGDAKISQFIAEGRVEENNLCRRWKEVLESFVKGEYFRLNQMQKDAFWACLPTWKRFRAEDSRTGRVVCSSY